LLDDDDDDDNEADRGVDDRWEEEGEGIAIRTATLIVGGGELELSSVIEIFAEIERELFPLSPDDEIGTVEELAFKNILARVSKEGGAPEEASTVRRFSSSSLLGAERFVGVGIGIKAGGEMLVGLGAEPE